MDMEVDPEVEAAATEKFLSVANEKSDDLETLEKKSREKNNFGKIGKNFKTFFLENF